MAAASEPSPAPRDLPPEVLEPGFQAWLALVRTYGSVSKVLDRRLTQDLGISLAWFELLIQLHTAPLGRRRLLDLSQRLVVSKASITKLVDRVERAGLVRREVSETDRRAVYAALTDSGRAVLAKALPLQVANVRECFSGVLDEAEQAALTEILGKVAARLRENPPPDAG
jgi:DNA-binding MarR family transcriptional regulator